MCPLCFRVTGVRIATGVPALPDLGIAGFPAVLRCACRCGMRRRRSLWWAAAVEHGKPANGQRATANGRSVEIDVGTWRRIGVCRVAVVARTMQRKIRRKQLDGGAMSELAGLKLLRRLEEGVAGKTGEAFFRQIVCDLSRALEAHGAFTSRLLPERRARMLAFWSGEGYEKCNDYPLAGTPCEFVYRGEIVAYRCNVGEIFPLDREWFEIYGIKSYLGVPVKNETGEVCGHLAVIDTRERDWHEADVDVLRLFSLRSAAELERFRYQRELEEANERLQLEITQRVVTEAALATAKSAAERANQAKSIFISQMSHELRTPLNGILGYAQLLQRRIDPQATEQLEGLRIIERSGEHLLTLVNDLLDLAKIEAGKLELHAMDTDLVDLLQHVADLARVRAEHAGLRFVFESAATMPRNACIDPRALRQVLLNILGNAVKFTPAGGEVSLKVTCERRDDQHVVEFRVTDTGIGIPTEELPRIFEPFHRVLDSGRIVEGTGLGLAITQRLVEALGGDLCVESTVGAGSTFIVRTTLVSSNARTADGSAAQVQGYAGRVRQVIVADDDEVNRALVSQWLESLGFAVKRATNGLEALQLLRAAPADLIVTDLVMPVVDGFELVRAVRSSAGQRSIPIVAMSASVSEASKQEALHAGCNAFVSKPIRFAAAIEEIGRLLQLEWLRTPQREHSSLAEGATPAFSLDSALARELYHLAMQGDVTQIIARVDEVLADDTSAAAFRSQLHALAEQYDTGAIRKALGAHCAPDAVGG
jgi:signal transduction histidine kinase/DNA-binding NarL/FixJ family response regulator